MCIDPHKLLGIKKIQIEVSYTVERDVLDFFNNQVKEDMPDPRWLAIAKTHIEEGFMAFRRSLIKKYKQDNPDS